MSKLIALDNGHGIATAGKRTPIFTDGTVSPLTGKNFMHEWEFNRRVVQLMKPMLESSGFRVLEVSPTDYDVPINERYKIANNAKADYFLSVHANAMTGVWNSANGVETLVKLGGSSESYRMGKIIHRHLVEATGLKDRCANLNNKLLERTDIGVLSWTQMPACLVECGFMDNIVEAKLLLSEDYRLKCAIALVKGVCESFGVKVVLPTTPPVKPKMDKEDANKIINLLKAVYGIVPDKEIGRLADQLRIVSGQNTENS